MYIGDSIEEEKRGRLVPSRRTSPRGKTWRRSRHGPFRERATNARPLFYPNCLAGETTRVWNKLSARDRGEKRIADAGPLACDDDENQAIRIRWKTWKKKKKTENSDWKLGRTLIQKIIIASLFFGRRMRLEIFPSDKRRKRRGAPVWRSIDERKSRDLVSSLLSTLVPTARSNEARLTRESWCLWCVSTHLSTWRQAAASIPMVRHDRQCKWTRACNFVNSLLHRDADELPLPVYYRIVGLSWNVRYHFHPRYSSG